jgi:predicted nucleic acid-binding protein
VPVLWCYEVGNGLLMAYRRKRISLEQVDGFLTRLKALPIDAAQSNPSEIFALPALAHKHGLTNYDTAYLAVALSSNLPLATADKGLRRAATSAGVAIASV